VRPLSSPDLHIQSFLQVKARGKEATLKREATGQYRYSSIQFRMHVLSYCRGRRGSYAAGESDFMVVVLAVWLPGRAKTVYLVVDADTLSDAGLMSSFEGDVFVRALHWHLQAEFDLESGQAWIWGGSAHSGRRFAAGLAHGNGLFATMRNAASKWER
jgi:hypothetical protein